MNRVSRSALVPHEYTFGDVESVLSTARGHLVISTSGSTGEPKHVVLSTSAITCSAQAADRALAGPGQWILALPTDHIAGVNVLTRSVLAGTTPVVVDRSAKFSQASFLAACNALSHSTTYVSLVPTQLHRLLEPGSLYDETLAALSSFAGILVGGAATTPKLLDTARSVGLPITTTYGMSETSGGCVYDGAPLAGVRVSLDPEGRISLGGQMVAEGYAMDITGPHEPQCLLSHRVERSNAVFYQDTHGVRWHRTNDIGEFDAHGLLRIIGRADDVILSGGLNISPATIEAALAGNFGIAEVVVVGVPDAEWGARVVALVTQGTSEIPPVAEIKLALSANLDKGHVPRAIYRVEQLPLTRSGKPDRRKAQDIAVALSGGTNGSGHAE